MAKYISYGKEAICAAYNALSEVSAIVGKTLGPGGRTILMSAPDSSSMIKVSHSKDGFNVLRSLSYDDPVTDAIWRLCLQASAKSFETSGDGTTSTIVMANAFANEILKESNNKNNQQSSVRTFRKEIYKAIELIEEEAVSGEDVNKIVALTSTNGDVELTLVVLDAVTKCSAYGNIVVEKNVMQKERYVIDKEMGYLIGRGYSPYLPLANSIGEGSANNTDIYLDDCYVVLFNGQLSRNEQVQGFIDKILKEYDNTPFNLLFVAFEVSESILEYLSYKNKKNKFLKCFACEIYQTAETNGALQRLYDAASFCGVKDTDISDGASAEHWNPSLLGNVSNVRISQYRTYLNGKSDENWIKRRARQNENAAKVAESQINKDMIEGRNASLTGGLVKISIGGGLYSDLFERADRCDDAIKSVQAAMRSGALPGCGASYSRAGKLAQASEGVQRALDSIHETIMKNFEETPIENFKKGQTVVIGDDNIKVSDNFIEAEVSDSFENIKSVIINSFELGSLIATLGGVSLHQVAEIEANNRVRDILVSASASR